MRARCVCDLERAYVLVAADHLAVRVLDGRDVGLAEGPADEPQHQRALADAARAEHHDAVIVALLRHHAEADASIARKLHSGDTTKKIAIKVMEIRNWCE